MSPPPPPQGVSSTPNNVTGIDAMCPSSKEDFTEFEKLLKEKISQFEKSVHYSSFLDSLFRELCISCKKRLFLSIYTRSIIALLISIIPFELKSKPA